MDPNRNLAEPDRRFLNMDEQPFDPYRHCEADCTHDLARGVLLGELMAADGPHLPEPLITRRLVTNEYRPDLAAAG